MHAKVLLQPVADGSRHGALAFTLRDHDAGVGVGGLDSRPRREGERAGRLRRQLTLVPRALPQV